MSVQLDVKWGSSKELAVFGPGRMERAIARALGKAGSTGLRDMKSEANKRVRARKKIKVSMIGKTFVLRRPKRQTIDGMQWGIDVKGQRVSLTAYPHRAGPRGVTVQVNPGVSTLIRHAFIATTKKSGHRGIWIREGSSSLPIKELLGSRPVDALLHRGEAEGVAERGARSLSRVFTRLLPLELDKAKGGGR